MQQHTMYLWHCFPITITKVDLEGEGLVCVPISPRICISSNDGMKLKISSVSPLMIIGDFISDDINHLYLKYCYRSQFPPYSHYVSFSQILYGSFIYYLRVVSKCIYVYALISASVSFFTVPKIHWISAWSSWINSSMGVGECSFSENLMTSEIV